MNINYIDSNEMDTEYDILDEIDSTLNDIARSLSEISRKKVDKDISYLRFLINELDDRITEEFKNLRRMRFIIKKTY